MNEQYDIPANKFRQIYGTGQTLRSKSIQPDGGMNKRKHKIASHFNINLHCICLMTPTRKRTQRIHERKNKNFAMCCCLPQLKDLNTTIAVLIHVNFDFYAEILLRNFELVQTFEWCRKSVTRQPTRLCPIFFQVQ